MTDEVRYCVFDDVTVRPIPETKRILGNQETSDEPLYVHTTQTGACPRNAVRESQTYTEGVSDRRSDDFG